MNDLEDKMIQNFAAITFNMSTENFREISKKLDQLHFRNFIHFRNDQYKDGASDIEDTILNYDKELKEAKKSIREQEKIIQQLLDAKKENSPKLIGVRENLEDFTKGVTNLLAEIMEENVPNTSK